MLLLMVDVRYSRDKKHIQDKRFTETMKKTQNRSQLQGITDVSFRIFFFRKSGIDRHKRVERMKISCQKESETK